MKEDAETLVLRVFLKTVDVLGGPEKLVEHKGINWLPSLLLACYSVVLKEEYLEAEQEIAQRLGITLQTVKNILRAEPMKVSDTKDLNIHTVGSVAKIAYRLVKNGLDDLRLSLEFSKRLAEALDVPWVYKVLRRLRFSDFPIQSPQDLKDKLKKIYIKGRSAEEVLEELEYPINSPLELVKNIRENLKMHGFE
ncbi:bacterio-opsin activator [Thermocrinis sp.]